MCFGKEMIFFFPVRKADNDDAFSNVPNRGLLRAIHSAVSIC